MTTILKGQELEEARILCMLNMKLIVPLPLTSSESEQYDRLTAKFDAKYPEWKNGINFITGEIIND